MIRARRYPFPGEGGAPAEAKPTPTKEQILVILDSSRTPVMTRPAVLVACARLFAMPPQHERAHESWARGVMDYPAAQRLFDRMVGDGLLVAHPALRWKEAGVAYLQPGAVYYATARRALAIQETLTAQQDEELRGRAEEAARRALARRHPAQFQRLVEESYAALRAGAERAAESGE